MFNSVDNNSVNNQLIELECLVDSLEKASNEPDAAHTCSDLNNRIETLLYIIKESGINNNYDERLVLLKSKITYIQESINKKPIHQIFEKEALKRNTNDDEYPYKKIIENNGNSNKASRKSEDEDRYNNNNSNLTPDFSLLSELNDEELAFVLNPGTAPNNIPQPRENNTINSSIYRAGIENAGATCYFNSMLKSLIACPGFSDILNECQRSNNDETRNVAVQFINFIADARQAECIRRNNDSSVDRLFEVLQAVAMSRPDFELLAQRLNNIHEQQDPSEFILFIFEILGIQKPQILEKVLSHDLENQAFRIPSITDKDYESYMISITTSELLENLNQAFNEGYMHHNEVRYADLPPANKGIELTNLLNFIQNRGRDVEQITQTTAFSFLEPRGAPTILPICLNRTTADGQTKIGRRVTIPFRLTIPVVKNNGEHIRNETYELRSAIVHKGSGRGGHYYTYMANRATSQNHNLPANWIKHNDRVVEECTQEEVVIELERDASVFMYERVGVEQNML